jgi:HK97 gp10 family phage protein
VVDKISVTIEGGAELLAALRRAGADVDGELESAALIGAAVIEAAAERLAPGPYLEKEVSEREKGRVTVDIGPDEDHWHYRFFETGAAPHRITGNPWLAWDDVVVRSVDHPGMAAQPFMRPAFDQKRGEAADAFGEALRKVLER